MKIKTSFGERCFDVFNTVFMTFLIIIMLYPMLYVAFASFSDSNLLQRHDGLLFAPLGFNLEGNYEPDDFNGVCKYSVGFGCGHTLQHNHNCSDRICVIKKKL